LIWLIMRLYRAGAILGLAVAALLHVTAAIAVVSAGYHLVEYRQNVFDDPNRKVKILGTLAGIAMVGLTVWICMADFGTARMPS
jgi:hypothetical protein